MLKFLSSFLAPTTRAARKSAPKAQLRLERLEDRVTPGAYTVSTTAATGAGSLTAAIAAMDMQHDTNNTITFNSNLNGAISIPGTISLSLNVVIDGNGSSAPITGNGTFRIFFINTGITVQLKYLQITGGGGAFDGSGIYNGGTLAVTNCSIRNNNSTFDGGGIYNSNTLTISQSSIYSNSAVKGGGVYNFGTLTIADTGTTISANTASQNGGGIYSSAGSTGSVTISGYVKIDSNSATNYGGGVYVNSGSFSLSDGEVDENSAIDGAGVYGNVDLSLDGVEIGYNNASRNGGGVYQNAGAMTCTDCIFLGNTCGANGVGPAGSWAVGPAITLVDCTGQVGVGQFQEMIPPKN
jgi:hypothetical protein